MAKGPWKKYKEEVLKDIDGKKGYVFEKKVYVDSNGQGHMFLPKRFRGKKLKVILIEENE